MDLFRSVLETHNPFPHGLFWTDIKGFPVLPAVDELLEEARGRGVTAEYVPIETFDALLLRIWRNLAEKPPELDAKVRKTQSVGASIPLPPTGRGNPIIRLNALPVLAMPQQCLTLSFTSPIEWDDLRQARNDGDGNLVLTKSDTVWCWAKRDVIEEVFGKKLESIGSRNLPADLDAPENLFVKGFVEEALTKALARGKPLLSRSGRTDRS